MSKKIILSLCLILVLGIAYTMASNDKSDNGETSTKDTKKNDVVIDAGLPMLEVAFIDASETKSFMRFYDNGTVIAESGSDKKTFPNLSSDIVKKLQSSVDSILTNKEALEKWPANAPCGRDMGIPDMTYTMYKNSSPLTIGSCVKDTEYKAKQEKTLELTTTVDGILSNLK